MAKTTTAVNLSAALAMAQKRVLLIDLDPQGHATLAFGYEPRAIEKTIYNVLADPDFPVSQGCPGYVDRMARSDR